MAISTVKPKTSILASLLLCLLAVACGTAPEATVVQPESTLIPTPTEPPTEASPVEQTEETSVTSPTEPPTEAVVEQPEETPVTAPTESPTEVPTEEIAAGGTGIFRDNLGTADQFVLSMSGVSPPPGGQVYQGWLLDESGTIFSVGLLEVQSDGGVTHVFNAPPNENLLAEYRGFQVTLEPEGGAESPTGAVVFAGSLNEAEKSAAAQIFVRNEGSPETPRNTAFGAGLNSQTSLAIQHIQNAVNAAAIGSASQMKLHLEHVVNILEGTQGARFGDYTGDNVPENPGDGFGVLGYATQMAAKLGAPEVDGAANAVAGGVEELALVAIAIIGEEDAGAVNAQLQDLKARGEVFQSESVHNLYMAAQSAIEIEIEPTE